jgi:DNA-damage-inducible protein J
MHAFEPRSQERGEPHPASQKLHPAVDLGDGVFEPTLALDANLQPEVVRHGASLLSTGCLEDRKSFDNPNSLGYNQLYVERIGTQEVHIMAQTTFSVRMDTEVKKQFDAFCSGVGMNASTAINMFARAVLRERRLPFDVTTEADPFYSESNLAHLRRGVAALKAGLGVEHGVVEAPE